MRHWIVHPLVFYPLAILLAGLVIAVSLRPQSWPREPAPVAAQLEDGAMIFSRAAFNSPAPNQRQHMTVTRDFWGNAQTLRIAVLPNEPPPTPAEQGVRLMLTREDAARIENRPVTVEVTYNPSPVNAATGLAVSLQGTGPAAWVSREIRPQRSIVRFELPAQSAVNAIGLRALNEGGEQAFGLEITRIRITPHTFAAAAN